MRWWKRFRSKQDSGARRRKDDRFNYHTALSAKCSSWPKFIELMTGDISAGGLFIPTDELTEVGETINLDLQLPEGESISLLGTVVRVLGPEQAEKAGRAPGLGIHIEEVPGASKDAFEALLARARSSEPRPEPAPVEPPPPTKEAVPVTSDDEELLELDDEDILELDDDTEELEAARPVRAARSVRSGAVVVGIDLGTTNTSVAAAIGNRIVVLEREDGTKGSPSVLWFPERGHYVVGTEARRNIAKDPGHVIQSPKRLLGRQFSEPEVQQTLGQAPFRSMEGPDGSVIVDMWGQSLAIPQLCGYLLEDARATAERQLGCTVEHAVVSVPTSFDEARIEYLYRAGQMAGIEIVAVIDEPSAAALANRFDPNFGGIVGVYDFGGGTFDFSVVDVSGGDFQVLATAGDTWLGGDDFDSALAEAAANQFWRKHKVDLRNQVLEWQKLLFACERAKRALTSSTTTAIYVPEVLRTARGMVDLNFTIDRNTLHRACERLIQRTLTTCDETLQVLGMAPTDLSNVYLSGGTTYIPAVRDAVSAFFRVPVRTGVPADFAVCLGASIHAAQLQYSAATTLQTR